ncbi:MAG: Bax inhibitor-1 family protein [Lachnospiraceae bacterium]|nr:Bax inhibitor-1 family protein [Lachnospiraceae bacterium]
MSDFNDFENFNNFVKNGGSYTENTSSSDNSSRSDSSYYRDYGYSRDNSSYSDNNSYYSGGGSSYSGGSAGNSGDGYSGQGYASYGTNYDDYNSAAVKMSFEDTAGTMTERSFYVTIYGLLLWGFAINYLIVQNFTDYFVYMDYRALIIGYFVLCLAGMFVSRHRNPVICFIGYNMIVLPVGALVSVVLAYSNPLIVQHALLGTGLITIGMMAISFAFPYSFLSLGKTLSITLLVTIVVELALSFLGIYSTMIDYLVVGIFALYIGYDMNKAQLAERNLRGAVGVAVQLYLDIINIFLRLIRILGRRK